MDFSNRAYRNIIQIILIRVAPHHPDVMRQNPGQFPPRTASEPTLDETLLGTALALGLFAVLFTALVVPAVGVAAVALLGVGLLARLSRGRLGDLRAARERRRLRLEHDRSRI